MRTRDNTYTCPAESAFLALSILFSFLLSINICNIYLFYIYIITDVILFPPDSQVTTLKSSVRSYEVAIAPNNDMKAQVTISAKKKIRTKNPNLMLGFGAALMAVGRYKDAAVVLRQVVKRFTQFKLLSDTLLLEVRLL